MATVLSQRNPHAPLENRFPTYRHSGTFPPSCFHGLRAVAPLKPLDVLEQLDEAAEFPRPPSRGSGEAA